MHDITACNLCNKHHGDSWELHKLYVVMPCLQTSMLMGIFNLWRVHRSLVQVQEPHTAAHKVMYLSNGF